MGLGGVGALTKHLGFKHRSSVSNWQQTGIPKKHWPDLVDLAAEVGCDGLTNQALREANAGVLSKDAA